MHRCTPPAAPPHRRPRRRVPARGSRGLVAGSALAVLAVVATACSSGSSGSSGIATGPTTAQAAAAVRNAPAATLAAGSATVALDVSSDEHAPGGSSGPAVGLKMLGNYDFRSQQGDGLIAITGVQGSTTQPVQAHIIFTTAALYLQSTGLFAGLGGGKPWVKITASSFSSLFASAASSGGGGPLGSLGADLIGQPLAAFDLLDTSALTAAVVGHPTVGGHRTTEYAVTVDPAAAAARATGAGKALFQSLGTKPLHLDVWVDGSGRIAEVAARAPAGRASAGQITAITVTLSNLGSPVTVTVPAASQVASAPTSLGTGAPSGG